jgi:hypothetical protein
MVLDQTFGASQPKPMAGLKWCPNLLDMRLHHGIPSVASTSTAAMGGTSNGARLYISPYHFSFTG